MHRSVLVSALCFAGAVTLAVPAFAQSSSGSADESSLNTQLQISALQSKMRDLTGQIQVLTHGLDDLKQQLNRLSNDVDMRFGQLEHASGPEVSGPPGTSGTGAASAPAKPAAGTGTGVATAMSGSQPRPLGTAATPVPKQMGTTSTPPPATGQTTASAAGVLPAGNNQEQYNYAMGLLKQANYAAAAQAMREFVQRWPKDPLAGNAQYWLGETFYVRGDYANAATAFAQGYQKYPNGSKAPGDLLKLGMSLAALKQNANACRAYAHLEHAFPHVSQAMKDRLAAEKRRAGC